jgi:murein L,D-transpeptidase YafK
MRVKAERQLELRAEKAGGFAFIRCCPILAASGGQGPKMRKGDRRADA